VHAAFSFCVKGAIEARLCGASGAASQAIDHGAFYTPNRGGWEGKISTFCIFSSGPSKHGENGAFQGGKILVSHSPNFVLHRNKITWENAFKSTAYLGNVNTK